MVARETGERTEYTPESLIEKVPAPPAPEMGAGAAVLMKAGLRKDLRS